MRQLRAEPLPILPLPCLKLPVAVRSDNRADQEVRIWGINKKDSNVVIYSQSRAGKILPAHSRELRHAIVVSSSASLPSVSPSCLARAMRLSPPRQRWQEPRSPRDEFARIGMPDDAPCIHSARLQDGTQPQRIFPQGPAIALPAPAAAAGAVKGGSDHDDQEISEPWVAFTKHDEREDSAHAHVEPDCSGHSLPMCPSIKYPRMPR